MDLKAIRKLGSLPQLPHPTTTLTRLKRSNWITDKQAELKKQTTPPKHSLTILFHVGIFTCESSKVSHLTVLSIGF